MNTTSIHIEAAKRHAANIEHLAVAYRHPQEIVTPARTGGEIGRNRRRPAAPNWPAMFVYLGSAAVFAAALGVIARLFIG